MGEIVINLDKILKDRGMTSKELADKIKITEANLSIFKTGKAKGHLLRQVHKKDVQVPDSRVC